MKYALLVPPGADLAFVGEFATHADGLGFESVVVVEHTVVVSSYESTYPYDPSGRMDLADDCPIPDPLDLLAFLAARTTRIGLATGVLVLPNHHPVVLAKRAATVDVLSAGRLRLCVGMGWMREEIEACGVDFTTRGRRGDEQIDVLRTLWADNGPASHAGEFFRFDRAMSYPKPVQAGGIPIHIGGHSAAAARRAGRRGDGLQPLGVRGEELTRLVEVMRSSAVEAGRDPEALELTLGHSTSITPEAAGKLAARGATRVLLRGRPSDDPATVLAELTACATRLGLT